MFSAESGAVGCGLARYYLHIASLFEQEDVPEYVVEFCNAAIVAADQQVGASVTFFFLFSGGPHVGGGGVIFWAN